MTTEEKEEFLNLPKETKLKFLGDLRKKEKHEEAFEIMKILLETPKSKGGVLTDEVQKVVNNTSKIKKK